MINGKLYSSRFPNLLQFAKDSSISLQRMIEIEDPLESFRLLMTRQAYNEFLEMCMLLLELKEGQTSHNDEWSFIWGGGQYPASKFYKHHFVAVSAPKPIKWYGNLNAFRGSKSSHGSF